MTGDPLKSYLASVKFEAAPSWNRTAVRLARDDEGTYYFVDALDAKEGPADQRLFIGKRGAMTQARLKDVVVDSSGELYISDRGTLKVLDYRDELAAEQKKRGDVRRAEATWISRGKQVSLVTVSPHASSQLIVDELGAYVNEKFGNPCDVF